MSKCKDIRGELGTVHLLYLKSNVKGDSVDQVGMNLKNLIKKLISKYQGPDLNEAILDQFYESASNIFKGYNRSNKITPEYLRGVEKQDPNIAPEVIVQGSYLDSRLKSEFSKESQTSKFLNLSKIDSTEDLMNVFNGSSELFGLFMKRFNTDILNMTVFGFNSNNEVAFNNSVEQLNNNINSWINTINDEFTEKFGNDYSNVDSNTIAQELVDITKDDKSGLYRKFVSLHFKKLIELSQNKIIRVGKKGGYEPKISSSLRTGWTNNEFISSFDELGDFVKELVETRKVIDLDGKETGQTLNWSRIFFSVSKLYHYVDRTNNYYLDEVIADVINSKKQNKLTGKIVKESKIFDDINVDEWNTLNSLYIHFFNKDNEGFKSKDGNLFHSFYVRSNNSYKDSSSRNSNIIDYYDMVKYNFEKQLTNKYSQVVYDYDQKTFIQEDLNTIRTNKQRSMYVSGLNMYKDLFGYENLAEQIRKISPYFEVDITTIKEGYIIKYKGVELLNTSKLSTFNLNSIVTDDDFNNLNKLINYVISVNPTVVPTDIVKYDLEKSTNKRIKSNDVVLNTYTKTLLPILNRVLSIVGNKDLQMYSESETSESSSYKMALTEYSKWLDVMSGDNIKAVTLTAEGTFVPSFGQINMIKEVGTLVSFLKKSLAKTKSKKSPLNNNIFMQGDNAKFLMEPITDTFIYFKGKAIPVAKAGSTELFINHFMIKYLYNIANDDYNIQVQPTTFADKSKQTAIRVNSKSFVDLDTRSKQSLADKTNTELKDFLIKNVDKNYSLLLNHVIDTLNQTLETNFTTLSDIQKYIKTKELTNSDIIKSANSKGLKIFSTFFFEKGEINSLLLEIEKNPNQMSNLIQDDLNNSLQMIEDENIYLDYEMFKPTIEKLLNGKFGSLFGNTLEEFEKNWVDENTGRIIMSKKGIVNPLYERYFYEKNIYSENFRNLIAGSIVMHPVKGKAKNFMENVARRYVAQTKRTVGIQGTIHPYRLGMYNGIPYYEKVAFVDDPNMSLFNQLGNTTNQEVTDGASFSIFLSTILKNNSLLDQGGQQHHKSLGMMIDPDSGSFMLMKHADHSMTNERLRNSKYAEFNLNNIVKKMLNQSIDLNIDLTKDFNGKDIYKKGAASYKIDNINYTILDIIKQEGNNYNFIVESNDGITTDIISKVVQINSLHDLWMNLGGENSTTINTTTGKSVYDNSSWYNLADFVNKVGFYKNEKSLSNFINKNSDKFTDYKSFRKQIIGSRYDDDSSKEYIDERPTADSIYQPLKNKFISQITFTSAQKVGAINPNPVSSLANDEPFMSFDYYSSIYTGLQLDHEHHTDDSDITEPTQILSAILFNGDASQYNRQLQLGIKLSIIHNVAKYLKTNTSLKDIDLDKIREVVGNNFLTELKKKDLSNFASGVCMNIQNHISQVLTDANQDLNNGNVEGFNEKNKSASSVNTTVPFSDPGLYNAFVNIMNSTFTSLGIRRKLEGSMNILSPQNYFITVHEKDGKIMLAEEFDGEISYTPIEKHNVKIFDKIRITYLNKESRELDLKDYDSYQRFKNMEGDFTIEKIEGVGRRLLPQRIQFDINGATKDYYSIDSSNLMNYEKYIFSLKDKNKELYLKKLEEYKYIIKRSVNKFNITSPLVDSILNKISNGLGKENAFTEKERNVLKNIQSMYYKELKENHKTDLSVEDVFYSIKTGQIIDENLVKYNTNKDWKKFYDRLLSIDLQVDITNYNEIPAEVMMPANLAKNFLLEEGDNINDITEDLLYNRIGRSYNINDISSLKVIPESILLEHSGSNIYVVSKQDIERLKAEGKKIIPSYKYKGEDSNSKYIIDKNTGESISKVNSLQFYTYNLRGKNVKFVTYENSSDLSLLDNFDDKGDLRYSILVPWNKGVSNQMITNYSKELYTNFKTSLIGAMCRIPSQSKQSGMPMRIVGFIKTENNVSFVPAENLYLTGGDYDIDKIVQALLSFHRNGKIKKYNPYFLDFDSNYLIESLMLPVPDNTKRNVINIAPDGKIDEDTLLLSESECDLLSELESSKQGDFQISLNNFQLATLLLNKIVMSNKTKIGLVGESFSDNAETVQGLLDNMFIDGYKLLDDPSVLENVIVGTMIQSYKDGRNSLHTYAPMDSDRIKNIAKGSSKSELMAKFSPTNPITDVLMQITNMVGKDGIAISATGQKALSIIIDRYLKIKSGNFENIRLKSNLASRVSEVITGEKLDETRIINGFDLKGVGDNLVNFFRTQFDESDFPIKDPDGLLSNQEYWIKTKISSLYEEGDNSLSVSELITLSTDFFTNQLSF